MPNRASSARKAPAPAVPLRLRWTGPPRAPRLLLAHGAGAGMDSDFMSGVATGLGALGVRVVRFEFEYMARRRSGPRPPPDRAPLLLARFRAAVERLGGPEELVIGGKSMGGRMASMLADELGVRGVEAPSWYSIVAPAATPRPIVDRLHSELAAITTLPDIRTALQRQALEPTSMTPEQFAAFLRTEYDKWGRVIKALKLH